MQKSVGDEWTPMVSRAWIKIFSRILDVIIPVVIKFELENYDLSSKSSAVSQRQGYYNPHIVSRNNSNKTLSAKNERVDGVTDISSPSSSTSPMFPMTAIIPN
jgi:hypothetical protein